MNCRVVSTPSRTRQTDSKTEDRSSDRPGLFKGLTNNEFASFVVNACTFAMEIGGGLREDPAA